MNFYISLAILAVFIIWFYFSTENNWDLGLLASLLLGGFWCIAGVIIFPVEMPYTKTNVTPENYTVECTSRMCEVDFAGRLFVVKDAYQYNLLKDSTYTSLEIEADYAWWGNVVGEKLIVK